MNEQAREASRGLDSWYSVCWFGGGSIVSGVEAVMPDG